MLKSLRSRLIFSHILPSLIIIPLLGIAIVFVIEKQIILPGIVQEMTTDATMFSIILQTKTYNFDNSQEAQILIKENQPNPKKRIMLLDPQGRIIASSEPEDALRQNQILENPLVSGAMQGKTVSKLDYSKSLQGEVIDVMVPVIDDHQNVLGIVRMSYLYDTVFEQLVRLRYIISGILLFGLLLGALLGIVLAVNIANPIRNVTRAIFDLANGEHDDRLLENGPEEILMLLKAVNFLVEKLENLEKARRQLLANLVHELGRPLGALRTSIQVSQKGGKNDPAFMNELLDGMDQETARMQHLLDDLSNLHDQVLGALILDRQDINLNKWLPQTLRTWRQEAKKKGLDWEVKIPEIFPSIYADPMRLSQIIGNLTSNAIKYTPKGGMVEISVSETGDDIRLQVKDNGIGIAERDLDLIFTPLYRGDQSQRIIQGMGLGLSIAHDLTELHGGTLTVESEQGTGSIFTIRLPKNTTENLADI
jgi:signal transduction histidine kinase